MNQEKLIERALAIALEKMSENNGGPFGALIVRDGKVIAEGWNVVTSTNDPTAHAEIVAIRRACEKLGTFNLPDCDIYASCEPCPMCLGAIYWARLRHIYYANTREEAAAVGFDDDFIYREVGVAPSARSIPATRLAADTADIPFAAWAAKPDKVQY